MEYIALAGAVIYLILMPAAAGVVTRAVTGEEKVTAAELYIRGVGVMLGLFEAAFLLFANTGKSLRQLCIAWAVLSAALFALALVLCFLNKHRLKKDKAEGDVSKRDIITAIICFLLILIFIAIVKPASTDVIYQDAEKAVTTFGSGSFFGIDPLTGLWTNDLTTDDHLISVPAFYAVLLKLTGAKKPFMLLGLVIPGFAAFCAFCVLSEAGRIFGVQRCFIYPVFTLLVFGAGRAYRNPFYELLHAGCEGGCIVSFIILPAAFLVLAAVAEKRLSSMRMKLCCLGYIILLLAGALGAGGIGSGALLLVYELIIGALCLIFMYFQNRFTA
ncbi:MAG: hypothetical protein J5842_07400 [Lachnospiraceae bacterium]|nr:hypothetical protein [Lachnospiraceae bacterium]